MPCHVRPLILSVAWAFVVMLSLTSIDSIREEFLFPIKVNNDIRMPLVLFTMVFLIELMTCVVIGFGVSQDELPCQIGWKTVVAGFVLIVFLMPLFLIPEVSPLFIVSGSLIMLIIARHLTLVDLYCPTASTKEI